MSLINKFKQRVQSSRPKPILDDQIVALDIGTEYVKALVGKVSFLELVELTSSLAICTQVRLPIFQLLWLIVQGL